MLRMILEIIFAELADRLLFSRCRMSDARKVHYYVADDGDLWRDTTTELRF